MKNTQIRQNDESNFFWERLPKFITNKRIRWMDESIKKIFKYFARLLFVSQILLMIFFRYSQPHFDVFCVVSGIR